MEYNGWKNYETWCVHLWITNESSSDRYWRDLAKKLHLNDLAETLKAEIEDGAPKIEGLYSDLLSAAISETDWYEIAEALKDENEINSYKE